MKQNLHLAIRCTLVMIIYCACLTQLAFAKPSAATTSTRETIESLVAKALQTNPEVEVYGSEIAAAQGDYVTAGTWSNPQLSTTFGNKRVSGTGPVENGFEFGVALQQTFEWPGRIELREAIANKQIELARTALEQFKLELARKTRSLAYKLLVAQENIEAATEVTNALKSLREVLSNREPTGVTPSLEIRIIEAAELTTERRVTEAELTAQSVRFDLNQILGEPSGNDIVMQREDLNFEKLPDTRTLLNASEANDFEIRTGMLTVAQQNLKVELERNNRRPAISVGPYVTRQATGDREVEIGLGVTLPLQLWDHNSGNIASAQAKSWQAVQNLVLSQRAVERQVLENALIYERKLREIKKWGSESLSEFKKSSELADEHYRLGAVPIATYIELKKQYLEAVQALLTNKLEALEAAQDLERLTGLELTTTHVNTSRKKRK